MASSSHSGSDRDDDLDEDMEALRRACRFAGKSPSHLAAADSPSDSDSGGGEDSGTDDVELLRRLQERFALPSADADSIPVVKPLSSLPPQLDSDGEDDLETLRAIRRRFKQYESDAMKSNSDYRLQGTEMLVADATCGQETPSSLSNNRKCTEEHADLSFTGLHQSVYGTDKSSVKTLMYGHFPKSAQNFVDALKKNRSLQRFMRRKLIEVEARIEENKELKKRVRCLMDFELTCKQKAAHILGQKKDPRVRLISMQRQRVSKATENVSWKKVPALSFGPAENAHVTKYKMVMKRFPVSIRKQQWSKIDKEKLVKGVKQQYQEMQLLNSMNVESVLDGSIDSELMPVAVNCDLEITPEKIRSFLPLVNWDRLASLYLPGRRGAECESRWLNCEDPMINHSPWTKLEEKKLLLLVQERGIYNWINIAVELGTQRTPFQCLARYQRSLNPHILKKEWTEEEDAMLRRAIETFGDNNWQLVASNLEGRTNTQCSNRWRMTLNPHRRKVGRWSVDEDKRLKVAVTLFGAKNWNKIAQFAPGRTQSQCRERWNNCLDPSLNLEPWSKEEDAKLLAAIAEHGHKWAKVATSVPPRTDNQCRRRWKVLCPDEVPLLQAAVQMKRTVLISNFVGRESERPSIGPDDFSPLVKAPASEVRNSQKVKRISSGRQPKKLRAKLKTSFRENLTADGMLNATSQNAHTEVCLLPCVNSNTAEDGNTKGTRKKTSRAKTRRSLVENTTSKISADNSLAGISCMLDVNSNSTEAGERRQKKTPSDKQPGNSGRKSRRSVESLTADSMVISPNEMAPGALSLVPATNSFTGGSGRIKSSKGRTPRDNQAKKSHAKPRLSLEESVFADDRVTSSLDIVPVDVSFVHDFNSTTAGNGSTKRTPRKTKRTLRKTSSNSDSLQQRCSMKFNAEHRICSEDPDFSVNNCAAENAPLVTWFGSPAIANKVRKLRNKVSRFSEDEPIHLKKARIVRERLAEEYMESGDILKGGNTTSMNENLELGNSVSERHLSDQLAEGSQALPRNNFI